MTTSPVASINDDELDSIREYVKRQDKADNSPVCIDFRELRGLVSRLQDAEKDAARYRWLRDRAGVDSAFGDFMVFLPSGNYKISDQDKINTDQSIDAAMEKQP